MKTLKIQVPEGYEIDKKNSTFEQIVFKKIEKEPPLSIHEVSDRPYYINNVGKIDEFFGTAHKQGIQNVSTKERAEAFLALMQLVELRDAWNEGWKVDWTNNLPKYIIMYSKNKILSCIYYTVQSPLHFKSNEVRDEFLKQFKGLIETAKELL